MGGSVNFTPANAPGQGGMPRPVGQPGYSGQMPIQGIPANRPLALTPRTQPMTRPMPGRPMTDSSGRVIGGGQMPTNRFMPNTMGPGMQPGRPLGGPSIGFGMPPGQLPGQPGSGFGPQPIQPDGAPTDTPEQNPGMMFPGQGNFGGGKGGFGPSIGFGMPPGNFSSAMGLQPGAAGQGSPYQSGAQFSQNT